MCLKEALGTVLYLFNTLLLILSIIVIAFAAYIVYIVDSYKDQLNQNVVGDISFGRISQGVLILGIVSLFSCIFACCAGANPPRFTHDILVPLFVIVIPLFAVKRKSPFFAVSYIIFMTFLFIVEIVVAAVSVTVASDNLRTIKNSLTDKTEGLRTLSDLLDRYSTVASGILLATAISQFVCMLTMWWYRKLISDQAPPAPPPAPADVAVTNV